MDVLRMRAALLAAAILVSPVCLAQDTAGGPAAFEEVHAAFLENDAMQFERPSDGVEETRRDRRDTPGCLRAIGQAIGDVLSAIGPVFRWVFYLMLAGIVLAIAYFVLGETLNIRLRRREKDERAEDEVLDDLRPDAAAARSLLEEADALAKAGRYAEAVHLLLFRSIEDIQRRRDGGVPRSLTAREIGRLQSLPERARATLSPIIAVVERSFFGGRDVDADGWASARASYEDFAFGENWR